MSVDKLIIHFNALLIEIEGREPDKGSVLFDCLELLRNAIDNLEAIGDCQAAGNAEFVLGALRDKAKDEETWLAERVDKLLHEVKEFEKKEHCDRGE